MTDQKSDHSSSPKPRRLKRRRFAKARGPRASGEPSELSDESTTGSEPAPLRRKSNKKRFRIRLFVFRLFVHGLNILVILALLTWGAIKLFVKPTDVARMVKNQVEEQTGGRIDIGQVTFNILTRIKLENVQFYPPKAGDTRGSLYGGEVEPVALANFDALDVRYSIRKMLAGRLHINALQLIKPQMHLRQVDGVFNFDSILAYRAKKFPPTPVAEKVEEKKSADGGGMIIPLDPDLLYVPIEIMAQNVGLKDLRLDLIKEEKGKISQIIMTNGLSLDLGVHWFGNKSSLWLSLISPFERPLEVDIQDNVDGDLKPSLHLRTAMSIRLEISDLRRLAFDLALRMEEVKTPAAGFQDLGVFAKMRLALDKDLKGINIETISLSAADALDYDLSGKVSVSDFDFKAITLKLKQKLAVDLSSAATLAKPFAPDLKASGGLTLEDFKIEGVIEPDKLSQADKGIALPYASAILWLEDVMVDLPATGVSMQPLSGDISVAAGPALNGSGSQVDVALNLNIPKLDLEHTIKSGPVKAGVENFIAKIDARVLWPEMIAPILKVNVEAEHVTTSGKGLAAIDAPLYVDIDADGRKDLARMALAANIELSDLAEISAMADCQQRCQKFRSNAVVRLDSLANLHAIALPLGGALGAGDFMPAKLSGALDFQFAARGKLPDPTTTPVPELIKGADIRFNTQLNLAKVDAVIPFMKIDLKDFETRLLASGTTRQQKLDVIHKFESLSLAIPKKDTPDKPMKVVAERFQFETSVQNEIDGAPDLQKITSQLKTEVFNKVYFGFVNVDGVLPRPINDFRVTSLVRQSKLTDVTIDDIRVKLPDYGLSATLFIDTKLGADFLPQRLTTKLTADVSHTGDEKLPNGIKTSGKIGIKVTATTEDMKTALVDGGASFDKFNVNIPPKDGQGPATLIVEEISGEIPFKQHVPLPELKKRQPGAPGPAVAAVLPAQQSQPAPSEGDEAAKKGADKAPVKIAAVQIQGDDDGTAAGAGKVEDSKLTVAMDKYFEKNKNALPADSNLVAMVDYGTVRPFFPERRPLSIKRLEVANLELSQMEFDLELRQNWFALNQFVINFLGGKIQGDLQLAFNPMPQSLRTSIHMTRLDTRKLIERFPNLKGKASSWNLFSNPYLDGTVHLNYDMKNNDMGGGLEITSIGKEQLKMMLFYVDPFEQNPTITQIRDSLKFGEVRQVSVPIKNGEIGMDVDVRVIGAPFPTPKLTRFPISQMLQNFKDQAKSDEVTADAQKKS